MEDQQDERKDPMEIKFTPILWRLIAWRFTPVWIGSALIFSIYVRFNSESSNSLLAYILTMLSLTIGLLIGITVFAIASRREYEIAISKHNVSGPSAGFLSKKTLSIDDLDLSRLHKQSFIEKILFYNTIRSSSGQKIMIADFVYGKPVTNELYRVIEKSNLQPVG